MSGYFSLCCRMRADGAYFQWRELALTKTGRQSAEFYRNYSRLVASGRDDALFRLEPEGALGGHLDRQSADYVLTEQAKDIAARGRRSYVYVISNDRSFKVGKTLDPTKRITELTAGSDRKLRLLRTAYGTEITESAIRSFLSRYQIFETREWFHRTRDSLRDLTLIFGQLDRPSSDPGIIGRYEEPGTKRLRDAEKRATA